MAKSFGEYGRQILFITNTVLDNWLLGGRLFCDHVYPSLAKLVFPVLAKKSNIGLNELIARSHWSKAKIFAHKSKSNISA